MATEKQKLADLIEAIGERHGIRVVTATNRLGSVFTTPDWTDWPDEMLTEVKEIAQHRSGPDADYWVKTDEDE